MDFNNLFIHYSEQFISIMIIHLFAVISPGPDFLVVTKQSFKYGRTAAVLTSLGISFGILFHIFYCLIGLGYILSINENIFSIFKIMGGLYLCYIGSKSILSTKKPKTYSLGGISKKSISKSFYLGFITNVFNPKATLFFLSLFTLIIDINTPLIIQVFYGFWMSIITGLWFCLVSFFFTSDFSRIFISSYATLIDKIMGIILIFISIRIILF